MTSKIALGVSYDGLQYAGWQWQPGLKTVQSELERAIKILNHQEGTVVPAGRTDRGVHALGQVVHFTAIADRSETVWLNGLNANLPHDIRVNWVKRVDETFHARFSAIARHYRYLIHNQPILCPFTRQHMTWWRHPLDVVVMHQAAQTLLGEHDFSAFRGAQCQSRTPIRSVHSVSVNQITQNIIQIDIKANAFLHHMVRNIVGSLVEIGRHYQPVDWLERVLTSRDRRQAGMTAPPQGLYFFQVDYPAHYQLLNQTSACPLVSPKRQFLDEFAQNK